jgi:hypothetical protein
MKILSIKILEPYHHKIQLKEGGKNVGSGQYHGAFTSYTVCM